MTGGAFPEDVGDWVCSVVGNVVGSTVGCLLVANEVDGCDVGVMEGCDVSVMDGRKLGLRLGSVVG